MVLLLAGCLNLAPKPDPTRFYLLAPAADSVRSGVRMRGTATIGLREVELPGYLDQSQLVTRVGPNEVRFLETARWGEPLGAMITRVLAADLAASAGLDEVMFHPWSRSRMPSYELRVALQRFEQDSLQVVLDATWQARDSTGAVVIPPSSARLTEPATSSDPQAIIEAMNRTLAKLSRLVVEAVQQRRPSSNP
jgi:uncharacterized lipoprotein YmbA